MDLAALVREEVHALRASVRGAPNVRSCCTPTDPHAAAGTPTRSTQVVTKLLANALKFGAGSAD